MQTMLKIFDLGGMGNMAAVNTQKIAVRMNADGGPISGQDETGFLKCLGNFLSMAEDQVKSTLEELEWVSIEGAEGELAPVIDFTDGAENTSTLEALIRSFFDLNATQPVEQDETVLSATEWQTVLPDAEIVEGDPVTDMVGEAEETRPPATFRAVASNVPQGIHQDNVNTTALEEKALAETFSQAQAQIDAETDTTSETAPKAQARPEPPAPDFANAKPMADGKPEPGQARAMPSEKDLAAMESDDLAEAELAQKNPDPSASHKKTETTVQTGLSASQAHSMQPMQMTDKEDAAEQKPLRGEEDEAPAFQRMFAAKSSGGEDSSMSFQNSGSNGGKESQSHLVRESQPGADPHLNSISSKSVDSTTAAESHSSQSAQKTMENDVIRQIVQRMTLRSSGDQSRMTIQLKPEFLGNLKLDISTENQHVVVKMTAESTAVKEMIEHNIGVLKTELQQHGLNIDKFDVYVGQDNESWKQRQQDAASRQGRRGNMRSFSGIDSQEEETDRPLASTTSAGADTGKSRSGEIDFFA